MRLFQAPVMPTIRTVGVVVGIVLLTSALTGCAPSERPAERIAASPIPAAQDLAGTSWQLVRFTGGDGTVLVADDPAKYTLTFTADNNVNVRIDCNRGRGTWHSQAAPQLEFGPTRSRAQRARRRW
jgi:heat shock protein HslJ